MSKVSKDFNMTEKQIFQVACQISKVQTLADRGVQIKIETGELSPDDITKLFELKSPEGMVWVAFKELPVKTEDLEIPEIVEKGSENKSPAQRLRGVFYRYFEQNWKRLGYKNIEQFELFYKMRMEKIINSVKEKLI